MSKCTCGACEWDERWYFYNEASRSGHGWITWNEPRCPRCYDGLGEGGETTPAMTVEVMLCEYYCVIDPIYPREQPAWLAEKVSKLGNDEIGHVLVAILPLPEEVSPTIECERGDVYEHDPVYESLKRVLAASDAAEQAKSDCCANMPEEVPE